MSFSDMTAATLERLKQTFQNFIFDIFGLQVEDAGSDENGTLDGLMQLILDMRQDARANKDWTTSDKIRDALKELNIQVKDGKEGATWTKG